MSQSERFTRGSAVEAGERHPDRRVLERGAKELLGGAQRPVGRAAPNAEGEPSVPRRAHAIAALILGSRRRATGKHRRRRRRG
jgi:hypothetical protein